MGNLMNRQKRSLPNEEVGLGLVGHLLEQQEDWRLRIHGLDVGVADSREARGEARQRAAMAQRRARQGRRYGV